MAQKGDEQPDPKAVQQRVKEVDDVMRRLAEGKKLLDEATKSVKDLEKQAGAR